MAGQCIRMLVGPSLLVLLLMQTQRPLVEAVDKDVNLIYPLIKEAKFEPNCRAGNLKKCTMSLKTRAAQYKLDNTDLLDEKYGSLVRVGDLRHPQSLIDSDFRFKSGEEVFTGHYVEYVEGKLNSGQIVKGSMIMNYANHAMPPFLICEAQSKFEALKQPAYVCVRDNVIHTQINGSEHEYPVNLESFNLPFSAIAIQASPVEGEQNDYRLEMVLFDSAGVVRVLDGPFNSKGDFNPKVTDRNKFTLGPILWPMRDDKTKPASWIKNMLPGDIFNKLTYDRERKTESAYVQSVTQDGADGPVCFTQRPIYPKGKRICMDKGVTKPLLPGFNMGDPNSQVFINAHHRTRMGKDKTLVHLAYSLSNSNTIYGTLYMFCSNADRADTPLLGLELLSNGMHEPNCKPVQIKYAPNDIIGFKDGNCSRTIAFYDSIYTVHPDNSSIQENDIGPPKVLKGLDFYITAAYAVNKTINFFTGTNTLVMIDATLTGSNCDTLELNMTTKVVMTSQDYLYARAFQKAGKEAMKPPYLFDWREFADGGEAMKSPYLFDWREFADGDNDTSPAIASYWSSSGLVSPATKPDVNTTKPDVTPKPDATPKPDVTPEESGESYVAIIAVGLILGGLIITAAIMYLSCSRASPDDRPPLRSNKSLRPKTPPLGLDAVADTSTIKTVLSEHGTTKSKVGSKIAGSPFGPQKSRGSRRSKRFDGAEQQQQQPPQDISAAPATSTSSGKAVSKSTKSQRSSSPSTGFLKQTLSWPRSQKSSRKSKFSNLSPRAAKTFVANP